jgi:hypothetical protein
MRDAFLLEATNALHGAVHDEGEREAGPLAAAYALDERLYRTSLSQFLRLAHTMVDFFAPDVAKLIEEAERRGVREGAKTGYRRGFHDCLTHEDTRPGGMSISKALAAVNARSVKPPREDWEASIW